MSKNCIPTRLREEFYAVMQANDDDDLPDGAWFCRLEETAEQFIEKYKLRWADRNDAAHQYIRMCNEKEEKK